MIIKCQSTQDFFDEVRVDSRFLFRTMANLQNKTNKVFTNTEILIRIERSIKYHPVFKSYRNKNNGVITPGSVIGYVDNAGNIYNTAHLKKGNIYESDRGCRCLTSDGYLD